MRIEINFGPQLLILIVLFIEMFICASMVDLKTRTYKDF